MLLQLERRRCYFIGIVTVVRDYLASNFRFDDTRVKTIGLGKSEENDDKLEIRIYQ